MPRQREAAERIKKYILDNELQPGDELPSETELCDAVGASRSSVREAIRTLTALDIVTVRHGHGTYVGRLSLDSLVESLAFRGLLNRNDNHRVLGELVAVRQTMEQGLAAAIVDSVAEGPAGLPQDLHHLVDRMATRATGGENFISEDREFHLLLLEPLGNELLTQLTAAFWDVHATVTQSIDVSDADAYETVQAHRMIAEAVESRDSAAFVDAIKAHYAPLRRHLPTS